MMVGSECAEAVIDGASVRDGREVGVGTTEEAARAHWEGECEQERPDGGSRAAGEQEDGRGRVQGSGE
jgi:hypothetical protein